MEFERGNPYSGGLYRSLEKVKKLAGDVVSEGLPLLQDDDFAAKMADLERQIMGWKRPNCAFSPRLVPVRISAPARLPC